MDDRFQNLIRQRHTKLAWVLLGLFCITMLVVDRFAYRVVGFPDGRVMELISFSMIGMIAAQFILLSIWAVLGEGTLLRRMLFLVCAFAAMASAWLLGLDASFGENSVAILRRNEILFLGIIPIAFLSLSLPLIVLRRCFSIQLSMGDVSQPVREPITTIGNMMIITAVVAICLAGAQAIGFSEDNPSNLWFGIGMYSGRCFLTGLLFVLPTALLLFSPRRNFLFWSAILLGSSIALTLLPPFRFSFRVYAQIVGTTSIVVICGIGILRLFSYRLHKDYTNPLVQRAKTLN